MLFVVMIIYSITGMVLSVFFFKQKTAYEMRISDWSSDVCSSDLHHIADLHVRRDGLALFVAGAGPDGDHFALARLLLGSVWDDDAASGLLVLFDPADHDAVMPRPEFPGIFLWLVGVFRYYPSPLERANSCPSMVARRLGKEGV